MKRIIDTTYKDGNLELPQSLDIPAGSTVRIAILPDDDTSPEEARELANEIYSELSVRDLADIEQVALMSRHLTDSGSIDRAE